MEETDIYLVLIDDVHTAIAATRVMECRGKTAYTDENLSSMVASSAYALDLLREINGKTVTAANVAGKEIQLLVAIKDLKFFHNELQVWADYKVLVYLKDYLEDKIKEDKVKNGSDAHSVRVGGNGYSTAICCQYDPYKN